MRAFLVLAIIALALVPAPAAGLVLPAEGATLEVTPAQGRYVGPQTFTATLKNVLPAAGAPAGSPTTSVVLRLPPGLGAVSPPGAEPAPSVGWQRVSDYVYNATDDRWQVEYRPAAGVPNPNLTLNVPVATYTDAACSGTNEWQFLVSIVGPSEVLSDAILCDRTAPVIAEPADMLGLDATSATGRVVTYVAPATDDNIDPNGVASCSPASGSSFPIATSTVTCTASDSLGNPATPVQFLVEVKDLSAPVISPKEDVVAEATSAAGAVVTYDAPATTDAVDGDGIASCSPASGSAFAMGETTVICDATDAAGNEATFTTFKLTVRDSTAPVITAMADISGVEATSAAGATVTYDSPATTDAVDGAGVATCIPASGGTFAIGATTVRCNAADAAGNDAAEVAFTVRVVDTTRPVFAAYEDVIAEAEGPDGAVVEYASPTASDLAGAIEMECDPEPGALFALGSTQVVCEATDAAGNSATLEFELLVVDTTAPNINAPEDQTLEATGATTALAYPDATTSDVVDGLGTATCAPAIGTLLGLGEHEIACDATDDAGNAATQATFTVTIRDTTPPVLALPADMFRTPSEGEGASVSFSADATDLVDDDVNVVCAPASGSFFPEGATLVTCTATDDSGNAASGSFTVTVGPRPAELVLGEIVAPATGIVGSPISLRVLVSNVGDVAGTGTLDLYVNGAKRSSTSVSRAGGASASATVAFTPVVAGAYVVRFGIGSALTPEVTISVAAPPPADENGGGSKRDDGAGSWPVWSPEPAPSVRIEAPATATAGEAITLEAASDTSDPAATFTWSFDDGGSADGARVAHAWEREGTYLVTLVARVGGHTLVETTRVEVVAAPGAADTTSGADGGSASGGSTAEDEDAPALAPPTITATAPSGLVRSPATIAFDAPGAALVYSRVLDGSGWRTGTEVEVAGDGELTIEYYAVGAGGASETKRLTIELDGFTPTLVTVAAEGSIEGARIRAILDESHPGDVLATLTPRAGGEPITVALERTPTGYEAVATSVPAGEYLVTVRATDALGQTTEQALADPIVVAAAQTLEESSVAGASKGVPGFPVAGALVALGLLAWARRRR